MGKVKNGGYADDTASGWRGFALAGHHHLIVLLHGGRECLDTLYDGNVHTSRNKLRADFTLVVIFLLLQTRRLDFIARTKRQYHCINNERRR
jgi:hypothetical protein